MELSGEGLISSITSSKNDEQCWVCEKEILQAFFELTVMWSAILELDQDQSAGKPFVQQLCHDGPFPDERSPQLPRTLNWSFGTSSDPSVNSQTI